MRPAVFGRELIVVDNKFIALNIGYNYFTEHEGHAVDYLRDALNKMAEDTIAVSSKGGFFRQLHVNKKVSEEKQSIAKWKDTVYKEKILYPSVPVFRREIVIKNEPLRDRYDKLLLVDGDYSVLIFDKYMNSEIWTRRFGNNNIFSEDTFFDMRDYQNLEHNIGYVMSMARGLHSDDTTIRVAGIWGQEAAWVFIQSKEVADSFCAALQAGNLALVGNKGKLFQDDGCCFINLEEVYKKDDTKKQESVYDESLSNLFG